MSKEEKAMDGTTSGAIFSPCRKYRYRLWRTWDKNLPMVAFIGLNPSTADESKNDPTIRRCINYAKKWGYGGIYMLNIFAFMATDPKDMKAEKFPIGPDNDRALLDVTRIVKSVICAWGNHGSHMSRSSNVVTMFGNSILGNSNLHSLGLNKSGEPKHPLYLKSTIEPIPFYVRFLQQPIDN